jgi:hypothetical protein
MSAALRAFLVSAETMFRMTHLSSEEERNVPRPSSLGDFFQSQDELDLSYLLGLTREGDGTLLQNGGDWANSNSGNPALFTDFGFGMGGMGTGPPSSSWNGTLDGLGTVFGFPEDNHGAE